MSTNNFSCSKNGVSLTESFEGVRLTAYQDQVGVWTIGYGHTGPGVCAGLTITQDQANELLAQDVATAASNVNRLVTIPLTQDEFDALVDFTFNVGTSNFASSTLLRDLNSSNFADAATQFERWDHAGGLVVAGLLRRRQAETTLFVAGMAPAQDPSTTT
jgi:lysozyme